MRYIQVFFIVIVIVKKAAHNIEVYTRNVKAILAASGSVSRVIIF